MWALLSDGYKVIFDERAGTVEVYHLESDPAERHDLADREPLRARALLQRLLAQRYRSEMDFARSERGAGRAARRGSAPTTSLSWLCALGGPIFPDVTAGAVGPGPIMPPMNIGKASTTTTRIIKARSSPRFSLDRRLGRHVATKTEAREIVDELRAEIRGGDSLPMKVPPRSA